MSAQDDINALQSQINQMQQQLNSQQSTITDMSKALQTAYGLSSDTVKILVNAKTVGTNGNLGALSHADTLAGAPVGDHMLVRDNLALGWLAGLNRFSNWYFNELPYTDDAMVTTRHLKGYIDSSASFNSVGSTIVVPLMDPVTNKISVGRQCQAWEINAWAGGAINGGIAGVWTVQSIQWLSAENKAITTLTKIS